MTRQTGTAVVAGCCFVALAALLAVLPVPYVTWSPGGAHNTLGLVGGKGPNASDPMIRIDGLATYPTTGRLDLTTLSVTKPDSWVGLPQALAAYWLPGRDALPRDAIYPPGKSSAEVEDEEAEMMETAQDDAVVAALRAAKQPVRERPAVASVTIGGPAHQRLLPGDLILAVDGRPTPRPDDVPVAVRKHRPGEQVSFTVLRERTETVVRVRTRRSASRPFVASVGISVAVGYQYQPEVSFEFARRIGGPSAGLVFALAIYDKVTPGPLLAGQHVAGTGTIAPDGTVGAIGGIQEKIAAATSAGATAFLVPAPNCKDVAGLDPDLTLVKVTTLADGIAAVQALSQPAGSARSRSCG